MKSGAKSPEEQVLLERYQQVKEMQRDDEDSGRPEFQKISAFAADKQAKLILPNDDMVNDIDVVILSHKFHKTFYKPDNGSEEDSPLFCQSFGGNQGCPTQDGMNEAKYLAQDKLFCLTCPANVFGSKGKGKLCNDTFRLIVWSEKFDMPLSFKVSSTSWSVFNSYQNRIKNSDNLMCSIFTRIVPFYASSGSREWATFKFERGEKVEDTKLLSDLMEWNLKLEQEYQSIKMASEAGGIEPSDDIPNPAPDHPVNDTPPPLDDDDELPF
jgi:hypothetical protein